MIGTSHCARLVSLGLFLTLLVACAAPAPRPSNAAATPTPPANVGPEAVVAVPSPTAPPAPAPEPSPWLRLRTRFVLQGCAYAPAVERWARAYTQSPRAFETSWKRALPFLMLVAAEIERRDMPGELALLPYLESNYRSLPARGDRPAGIWQLVPDTAREAGLIVRADYDARLDVLASTAAALNLLARYYREFADWRLADMAFNRGEFRVKKMLGEHDPRQLSAAELAHLPLRQITHQHLERLLALSCIVSRPETFGVRLPLPDADDHLAVIELEASMDLHLAARLSGVDSDDMQRWNAAYRSGHMSNDVSHRLLLPTTRADRFQACSAALPSTLWSDWRVRRSGNAVALDVLARQAGIPVSTLAMVNALDASASIAPGTPLLMPQRTGEAMPANASFDQRVHIIVAGDSLSRIAHHYAISLARLRRLNPHMRITLQPGDRLLLDSD